MSLCIIELNDSEIRAARDARIILRSPGYAVIRNDRIQTGNEALKQAYLNPRETYNRFWDKLNQDSLQTPAGNYRHHADLAFSHLMSIYEQCGKPTEFIFAIHGGYTREQLALLLGITRACPFEAVGLVDSAVASAAAVVDNGLYQHLDIQLHKVIITQLNADQEHVVREKVEIIDDTGLIRVYTAVSALISDLFIQQCRFDPLHHAETEQALYDQLPKCLQTLARSSEVMLEIQYKNTTHQAKLHRDELLTCLDPIYDRITRRLSPARTTLLSDRFTILPGLNDLFTGAAILAPETVFRGCAEHQLRIRTKGPALDHITSLPVTDEPSVTAVTEVKNRDYNQTAAVHERITHVLYGHLARPLSADKTYLSPRGKTTAIREQDSHCVVTIDSGRFILSAMDGMSVYLNGKEINGGTLVQPGDTVGFTESAPIYTFINVN